MRPGNRTETTQSRRERQLKVEAAKRDKAAAKVATLTERDWAALAVTFGFGSGAECKEYAVLQQERSDSAQTIRRANAGLL